MFKLRHVDAPSRGASTPYSRYRCFFLQVFKIFDLEMVVMLYGGQCATVNAVMTACRLLYGSRRLSNITVRAYRCFVLWHCRHLLLCLVSCTLVSRRRERKKSARTRREPWTASPQRSRKLSGPSTRPLRCKSETRQSQDAPLANAINGTSTSARVGAIPILSEARTL